MDLAELQTIVRDIRPGLGREVRVFERSGELWLQMNYTEADISWPKARKTQTTRKWLISRHSTRSEVVQTALKCLLTSLEHQGREHFHYKGKRVFGPHIDIEAIWRACESLDERPPPPKKEEVTDARVSYAK